MRVIKHGLLGGVALSVMAFLPQAQANQADHGADMCMKHAAMEFQEAMQACDATSDKWERSYCTEKAREEFEEARDMCHMSKGNQGGGNQGGGNHGGGKH